MMTTLLLISAAVAAISVTVTQSSLFRSVRKWLKPVFGKLFDCSYCLNHWVAFGLVINYSNNLLDFIIKSFAVVTFSGFLSLPLLFLLEVLDNNLKRK